MLALQSKALPGIKQCQYGKCFFENPPCKQPNILNKRHVCVAVLKKLVKFTLSKSYQNLKND